MYAAGGTRKGCIAGALPEATYRTLLAEIGFSDIEVQVTRCYSTGDISCGDGCGSTQVAGAELADADGLFVSAFIRATKPQ
ncbi:MAG TPA: hypothetical protein VFG99_09805 [Chloroflexia bacterium]|nr:hypothetical protein [Chloroflexia bacterium]